MLNRTQKATHLSRFGDPISLRKTIGDDPIPQTMGARIRELREKRGLTQEELAAKCEVTKSAVSQWESDSTQNVRLQPFLKLLEALNTRFEYLIYGKGGATPV